MFSDRSGQRLSPVNARFSQLRQWPGQNDFLAAGQKAALRAMADRLVVQIAECDFFGAHCGRHADVVAMQNWCGLGNVDDRRRKPFGFSWRCLTLIAAVRSSFSFLAILRCTSLGPISGQVSGLPASSAFRGRTDGSNVAESHESGDDPLAGHLLDDPEIGFVFAVFRCDDNRDRAERGERRRQGDGAGELDRGLVAGWKSIVLLRSVGRDCVRLRRTIDCGEAAFSPREVPGIRDCRSRAASHGRPS